jgi:hypothetical protein
MSTTELPILELTELEFPALDDSAFADTVPLGLDELPRFNDVRATAEDLTKYDPLPDPLRIIKAAEPMLYTQIMAIWGSPELSEAFNRWLLVDNRHFTAKVATALLQLSELHSAKFDTISDSAWASFGR